MSFSCERLVVFFKMLVNQMFDALRFLELFSRLKSPDIDKLLQGTSFII